MNKNLPRLGYQQLCVSCNSRSNLLKIWHAWHGFCFLISHTDNTQDTQGPIDCHTYKYILTPPECTHSSFLYYTEWIICCWHKKYFTEVHKIFAFQILITCAGDRTTKCKDITNCQLFLMAFYKELLLCMKITRHDLMTC